MVIEYSFLILGFLLLLKGADWLVDGSSALARKFDISPLAIGLTIVAFGTSMPELVVNTFAALQQRGDISFGNIIGTNIFNILFILGLAAVIKPLKVKRSTIWKEIPFAFLAVLVLFLFSNKELTSQQIYLTRTDGWIMLLFFSIFMYYIIELIRASPNKNHSSKIKSYSGSRIALFIIVGLIALYFGGRWVVDGAVFLARQLGFSELFISATIIAAGTSLPELATSAIAAFKRQYDLSVGNIVGSNIFNIFLIMAITAVISPTMVPASINLDFAFLFATTILLFISMFIGTKHELDRWQGAAFIVLYVIYVIFLLLRG